MTILNTFISFVNGVLSFEIGGFPIYTYLISITIVTIIIKILKEIFK